MFLAYSIEFSRNEIDHILWWGILDICRLLDNTMCVEWKFFLWLKIHYKMYLIYKLIKYCLSIMSVLWPEARTRLIYQWMSYSKIVIAIHTSLMKNNLQKMYSINPAFSTRGRTEEGDNSITSSVSYKRSKFITYLELS